MLVSHTKTQKASKHQAPKEGNLPYRGEWRASQRTGGLQPWDRTEEGKTYS